MKKTYSAAVYCVLPATHHVIDEWTTLQKDDCIWGRAVGFVAGWSEVGTVCGGFHRAYWAHPFPPRTENLHIPHQWLGPPAQLQTPYYPPQLQQRPQPRVTVRSSLKQAVCREIQAAVCGEVRAVVWSLVQACHSQGDPGRQPWLTQGHRSRGKQARKPPGNPGSRQRLTKSPIRGSRKPAAVRGPRLPAAASGHPCAPLSTGGIWGYALEPSSRAHSSAAPSGARLSRAHSSSARSVQVRSSAHSLQVRSSSRSSRLPSSADSSWALQAL